MTDELVFAFIAVPAIVILIATLDAFERVAKKKQRERAAAKRSRTPKPDS